MNILDGERNEKIKSLNLHRVLINDLYEKLNTDENKID